jgi:hypothetical protein
VLPSEFCCPVLADPNLRFCRSLASRSTPVNVFARLTSKQTIDLKSLNNQLCLRDPKPLLLFECAKA